MNDRIAKRFAAVKSENRGALVTYIMAGDPDRDRALEIMKGLPGAGVDIIELGMPFSDPMADGPAIQAAAIRSLKGGMTLKGTLDTVAAFRKDDQDTPVILMGYYNPVFIHGVKAFAQDAVTAGVDGVILVDLPPEEVDEVIGDFSAHGLSLILLTTPTADKARLAEILRHASGFVYHVSITGITGAQSANDAAVTAMIKDIRSQTDLPIVVGFGINTPEQARAFSKIADGAVVGSALVRRIADDDDPLGFVADLAQAVRAP